MYLRITSTAFAFFFLTTPLSAQSITESKVPAAVKSALAKRYPSATGVAWEREKGNFEANWGGHSKEDNSVLFTPTGEFVEMVSAIPVNRLPPAVAAYVQKHFPGAKITEAGKVTDVKGAVSYEAEVRGKDLRFDEKGNYVKAD
jgi:hypothetical protein